MRKFLAIVLNLAFLSGFTGLSAQEAEVGLKLDVDQRQVEVGGKLTVTVEFKQIGTGIQSISEPSIATSEHFEIEGRSSAAQVVMANKQTATISTTKLTLVATKPGEETI